MSNCLSGRGESCGHPDSRLDRAEQDVLAFMAFPKDHWPKIASTNCLERLNKEIKPRSNVVGIFPNNEAA